MPQPLLARSIGLVIGVVALFGLFDAVTASEPDLVCVFAMIVLLSLILLIGSARRRRPVLVRADLARWMADRAAVSGERVEDVADRALSAYRAGLLDGNGAVTREPV